MRSRWLVIFTLLLLLPTSAAAKTKNPQADPLSTGDQADHEISRGFFIDSEVGLLTFLAGGIDMVGDGALVYRPGMMLSLRLGVDLSDTLTVYGKIGGTVTGNTPCFSDPRGSACAAVNKKYGFPPKINGRPLPRQGVSLVVGPGIRWAFYRLLDDRLNFHLMAELLAQIIPPDSIPEANADRVTDSQRKQLVFGGGVGIGVGAEYFFVLKHFSAAVNIRAYYFATPFMENSFLGLAVLASAGLKYTF